MNEAFGTLYLVATPIGNLEDMTLRALRILKEVDLIAAEDTRNTLRLLNHFEIHKPLTSYHEHNRASKGPALINDLLSGKQVALVTDAGTPGISDPGEDLVRLAADAGIRVVPVPGCAALINGLIASGLPTGRFCFEGFLSAVRKDRLSRLESLKNETRTMIFYEAPHKLLATLSDMASVFGDREVVFARELTKKFEEIKRTTLLEGIRFYEENPPKGEFVLILHGADENVLLDEAAKEWESLSVTEHVEKYLSEGLPRNEALKKVASDRRKTKREIYQILLEEKQNE